MEMSTEDLERLKRLADRLEIEDVYLRWCRGVDRADVELMDSTYHPDAVDEHGEQTYTGETAGRMYIENHVRAFKRHRHINLNTLIGVDGAPAVVENYQLALLVPRRPGPEQLLAAAGRYVDRLERRDGEWRFVHRHYLK